MRIYIIGFIIAVALIAFKALYLDSSHIASKTDSSNVFHLDGNVTASFDMKDTDGNSFSVLQYNDQFIADGYDNNVVIFNFFGTFCPSCRAEIPMLTDLKNRYGDKVKIIGVSVDDDLSTEQLKEFKNETGAEFSMSIGTDRLRSLMCATLPEGSCHGIPLTVVYSKGKLQIFKEGSGSDLSYIENIIASVEQTK
ncbi:MAG: TlpA disulfide reductase family protein [Sulfuricurvum sp.]|nr:TlpA disulfide reductase family protein [Sulfuricurvum sp.]